MRLRNATTAIRETYEEVGLSPDEHYFFISDQYVKFPHNSMYFFVYAYPHTIPISNDNDVECVKWFRKKEISKIWSQINVHVKHFVKTYF